MCGGGALWKPTSHKGLTLSSVVGLEAFAAGHSLAVCSLAVGSTRETNRLGAPATGIHFSANIRLFSNGVIFTHPRIFRRKEIFWDPPRGSQRVPEEESESEFNGKVARNNGLKNDFFQFLT